MRSYEVRVYSGLAQAPDLHLLAAAADDAAAARAEQLFVDSLDAVGVDVIYAGERLYARGVVPAAPPRLAVARRR